MAISLASAGSFGDVEIDLENQYLFEEEEELVHTSEIEEHASELRD